MLRKRFESFQAEHPFDNLNEIVYSTLYSSIIDLSLVPGVNLSETAIADQMGVSRTPVRNALTKLLSIGLVVQNKGQAFQVAEIEKDECRELMEARLSIEAQCAFWAADRAREADLKSLDKAMADYTRAYDMWDIDQMVESDHRFHQLPEGAEGHGHGHRRREDCHGRSGHAGCAEGHCYHHQRRGRGDHGQPERAERPDGYSHGHQPRADSDGRSVHTGYAHRHRDHHQ